MEHSYRSSSESGLLLPEHGEMTDFAPKPGHKSRWQLTSIVPWVICIVLLAGWIIEASKSSGIRPQYWRQGELEIARKEVSTTTKRIRFTGGLRYNESKQLYRQIEPGTIDYVDFPTPEIDAAWEALISTTDIFLTEPEMLENVNNRGAFADLPEGDRLYTDPFSGLYQAVPSVFHDLHCLDKLRRAIYNDNYPDHDSGIFWPHVQHCIDTIRQSLMCHGDLTPIPEAYTAFKPDGTLEPIFQVYHTCRDFGGIQAWAKSRDSLDEAVWRENADRLKGGSWT